MKKALVLLVACILLVGTAVCTANAADTLPAQERELVIGFSNSNFATPWRVALGNQMEAAIQKLAPSWKLIKTDGQSNAAKQVSDVEDLIVKGVDAIIMSPYQSEPLAPVSKQCLDAGIPLILVDRTISTENYTAFVGGDNVDAGVKGAEMILKLVGQEGKIGVVQGTFGSSAQIDRNEGFRSVIDQYPGITIVSEMDGDFRRDLGVQLTEDIITSNPDVKAIYYQSSNSALGGLQALEAAKRTDVHIISTDGSTAEMDLVKEGKLAATIIYPTGAEDAIAVTIKILNGEPYEKYDKLDTILVTQDNVDEYYHLGY